MKPNFQKFLTRKYSVLMDDAIIRAWMDEHRFHRLSGVREYVRNIEVINGDFCFDMNWMDQITKNYGGEKTEFFYKFSERGYFHGEKLVEFVRNLDLSKNQKALEKDFYKSLDLLFNLLVFVPDTHPLAKIIENRVRSILSLKDLKGKNFEEVLIELTQPKKLNTPILEQLDLKKIKAQQANKKFDLEKAIENHHKKYSFLGYREPFSKGFDVSFYKKRLKEKMKTGDNISKTKIKLDKDERMWIEVMQEMVWFRNYRTEKMIEAFYYLEPLWNAIGKFYDLGQDELAEYQISEINDLFAKRSRVKKNIIKTRKRGHGFLVHRGKVKLITGGELKKKIKFYNSFEKNIKEFKGSIACSGVTKGPAKVVLSSKEQGKIKNGDILVTSMTTPDYLPSMRRASAFVTDEGGITCHAAIVAREMKKPCIIGTKIATKVLKDGDLVEVDANKGIVKIINNS